MLVGASRWSNERTFESSSKQLRMSFEKKGNETGQIALDKWCAVGAVGPARGTNSTSIPAYVKRYCRFLVETRDASKYDGNIGRIVRNLVCVWVWWASSGVATMSDVGYTGA